MARTLLILTEGTAVVSGRYDLVQKKIALTTEPWVSFVRMKRDINTNEFIEDRQAFFRHDHIISIQPH